MGKPAEGKLEHLVVFHFFANTTNWVWTDAVHPLLSNHVPYQPLSQCRLIDFIGGACLAIAFFCLLDDLRPSVADHVPVPASRSLERGHKRFD
jgi:hypothetical protein